MRFLGYALFTAVVTFFVFTRGVSDYDKQYAHSDGDADLGPIRGIEWGFFAFLACVAVCVAFEIANRRMNAKGKQA
jgi:hypothetical protein